MMTLYIIFMLFSAVSNLYAAAGEGQTPEIQYKALLNSHGATVEGIVQAFLDLPAYARKQRSNFLPLVESLVNSALMNKIITDQNLVDRLELALPDKKPLIQWLRQSALQPSQEVLAYLESPEHIKSNDIARYEDGGTKKKSEEIDDLVTTPSLTELLLRSTSKNIAKKLFAEIKQAKKPNSIKLVLPKQKISDAIEAAIIPFNLKPQLLALVSNDLEEYRAQYYEDLAKDYFLKYLELGNEIAYLAIPGHLLRYFKGVSVQNLLDNNLIEYMEQIWDYPPELQPYALISAYASSWWRPKVYAENRGIKDLKGFGNIPNKKSVREIYLKDNLIESIDANTFDGFDKAEVIDLSNNNISKIEPGTFTNLRNLKKVLLYNNPIAQSHQERIRISREIDEATDNNAEVIFMM